jgi:hypothetical protein
MQQEQNEQAAGPGPPIAETAFQEQNAMKYPSGNEEKRGGNENRTKFQVESRT